MKQRNDFPVLNAVDIYDPHYTPKSMDETAAKDVKNRLWLVRNK